MGLPDTWIKLLKTKRDEHWNMQELVSAMCNRRFNEKTVAYVECHDQSLVGDVTLGAAHKVLRCSDSSRKERQS